MTSSALLCSMPAVGHVGPLLVVAQELQRRGWRVRLLTGARYRRMVEDAGIPFLSLPPEADTLDGIGAGDEARDRGLATINRGVERAFIEPAGPAAVAMQRVLDDERADVVLHDMTFLGVQALFGRARSERPLTVMCGIGPAGFSSRDTAPYGLGITPLRQPALNRLRNAVLGVTARAALRPVHRSMDRFLSSVGAPALRGAFFMDVLARSDLLAQFTVDAFEYPRSDAPWNLRFYGPMATAASQPTPAPDWFDELDPSRPLVHVTQGTVANTDWSEVIAPTLVALADLPVQVAVTTGGRDVDSLPSLPDNAFAASYLPYDELLQRTRVLVTNGGYGGLHHAMRHGVPIVIAGDSEDKVETSARVQYARVGVNLRTGRPRPDAIRAAVLTILSDPGYAARARRVGEAISTASGAVGLVDDIERMLSTRV